MPKASSGCPNCGTPGFLPKKDFSCEKCGFIKQEVKEIGTYTLYFCEGCGCMMTCECPSHDKSKLVPVKY